MPTYLDRTLQPDETVLYRARLHWIIYAQGAALVVAGAVVWIASAIPIFFVVGEIVMAVGLLSLAAAAIQRFSTELAITSKRVLVKRGLFVRNTVEMSRSKIETVGVKQGIAGRMLDYGTVIVRGTGGGLEPLKSIDSPLDVRRHILE